MDRKTNQGYNKIWYNRPSAYMQHGVLRKCRKHINYSGGACTSFHVKAITWGKSTWWTSSCCLRTICLTKISMANIWMLLPTVISMVSVRRLQYMQCGQSARSCPYQCIWASNAFKMTEKAIRGFSNARAIVEMDYQYLPVQATTYRQQKKS